MVGLLDPEFKEVTLGRAEVRETFKVPTGMVAGCYILEGKIVRSSQVRVVAITWWFMKARLAL